MKKGLFIVLLIFSILILIGMVTVVGFYDKIITMGLYSEALFIVVGMLAICGIGVSICVIINDEVK